MSFTTDLSQDKCFHYKECSGCSLWDIPYEKQLIQKKEKIDFLLKTNNISVERKIEIVGIEEIEYRNRFDFTFYNGISGLYSKNDKDNLIDIIECKILDPNLKLFFKNVKGILVKHQKIFSNYKLSIRLRNNKKQKYGVWIDTANELIKTILEQKLFLEDLMSIAIVEIGQKNKRVIKVNNTLKLSKEPILENWFDTKSQDFNDIPLYLPVGAFTQPSVKVNELLIKACERILANENFLSISELFSGMGNFTLYLLSKGLPLKSYEMSGEASDALLMALRNYPELKQLIQFKKLNLYSNDLNFSFHSEELLFVDPPRSGLGRVIDYLSLCDQSSLPGRILYVSCFENSLVDDLKKLNVIGFKVQEMIGVDQFAMSNHIEWITYLKLNPKN